MADKDRIATEPKPASARASRHWTILSFLLVACHGAIQAQPMDGTGFRSFEVHPSAPGKTGFTRLAPAITGIDFTNRLSDEAAAQNQIRLNGSGVALGDIDGDGWCDIYFCALQGGNRLFRNLGNWKFQDITDSAGVACEGQYSTGCALVDLDGDGRLDLLVNGVGTGTRCFMNQGGGRFREVFDAGFSREFGSTSMALADIDGDGDLDLYVANYRTTTIRSTGLTLLNRNGKRTIRPEDRDQLELTPEGRVLEHGEPDILYRNDGSGHFTRVSWTDGSFLDEHGAPLTAPPHDWGLSVMFRDINQDGLPDLYVCNDFHSPDRIWINQGGGKFRALPPLTLRHTSTFSMSVDFADINRDGHDDIFVGDMLDPRHSRRMMQVAAIEPAPVIIGDFSSRPQYDRNTLQLSRGDGTFSDIAFFAGIEATTWTWSSVFLDVDLDGFEDLLMTTGHMFDTQDLDANERIRAMGAFPREQVHRKLLYYPRMKMAKAAYRNNHQLGFEPRGAEWGFADEGVAHGMALADLDNDGDLDVVVNDLNQGAGIYRNDSTSPRLAVRLRGNGRNTSGAGARITVRGGPVDQSQEIAAGGRYLSCDQALRVFATGTATQLTLEVRWPGGKQSRVTNAAPNRIYEIFENAALPAGKSQRAISAPLFADVSASLGHRHHEDAFDDFAIQPLLPHRLGQLGPGIAWGDLDGDGREDLVVGTGKGGQLSAWKNQGDGRFEPMRRGNVSAADQSGLAIATLSGRSAEIIAGLSAYRAGTASEALLRLVPGSTNFSVVMTSTSDTGPIAVADVDGDGDLDLFVGGRFIPGRFPEAAASRIFRNESGRLVEDLKNAPAFQAVGLVSGAVFSDLDGDGYPELILACEWGSLRVFHNDHGTFTDVSRAWRVDGLKGLWMSVATGDVNGDGKPDLVASNWGLNTGYRATFERPQRLYFGELNGNGRIDLIESHFDSDLRKWVPERDLFSVAGALPFVAETFKTHAAYAQASVEEICGAKSASLKVAEANFLATTVFINRGDHFESTPLPPEAQFAPAFGVNVADLDGDGNEDIFLSQNFFALPPQVSRCDAGRGLWLRGDGRGAFMAMSGERSGIEIYGEQRGSATADYDEDGRIDLVVAQNGAETRLYHNVGARPGLLVRLAGPAGNPTGVGAALQLIFKTRSGPIHEVQAGSGYWSQNGSLQVLSTPETPTRLRVRWPGGRTTESELSGGARSVRVHPDGSIDLLK